MSTLLLYASLVRVSRKSGLLDDRRRGCRGRSFRVIVTNSSGMCAAKLSKVSGKCQVAPEANKVRILASLISPADTISSLTKLDSRDLTVAITGEFRPSPGALHIETRKGLLYQKHEEEAWIIEDDNRAWLTLWGLEGTTVAEGAATHLGWCNRLWASYIFATSRHLCFLQPPTLKFPSEFHPLL